VSSFLFFSPVASILSAWLLSGSPFAMKTGTANHPQRPVFEQASRSRVQMPPKLTERSVSS
jgi:hypothetical protein